MTADLKRVLGELGENEYAFPDLQSDQELLEESREQLKILGLNEFSTVADLDKAKRRLRPRKNPLADDAIQWADQQLQSIL